MGANRSIIIVAVAAAFALLAALLVGKLVSHPKPAAAAAPPPKLMAQVLVAHRDLQVGTTLSNSDMAWQAWPVDALNAAFITDPQAPVAVPQQGAAAVAGGVVRVATSVVTRSPMDALAGAIVREPILANEPITNAKLVRGGEGGFMAVVLHPGMRAVAISVNSATAAGGFILPGDHVDVMQSHQEDGAVDGGHSGQVARVLLRNVRVLAVDQTTKPPKNSGSVIGAVATLEVPAADADVLVRAKAQGEIVLALRAYSDAGGAAGRAQADNNYGLVRIYRDGKASEVTVSP